MVEESEQIKDKFSCWIKTNWKKLLIASVFLMIGVITLYFYMGLVSRAELLLTPCQLCQEQGYRCSKIIPIDFFTNITK